MKHILRLTLIVFVCYLASILFFAPRYFLWTTPSFYTPETNRAICELARFDNLSIIVPGQGDTIRWRLLFPVFVYLFRFPPIIFFALPFVMCAVLLFYVAQLTYRETGRYRWSLVASALVATSAPIFISTGFLAYFDSALALGIVAAAFTRRQISVGLIAGLTVWIDERFIFALPIIAWVQWMRTKKFSSVISLLVGIAPYLAVRLLFYFSNRDIQTQNLLGTLFSGRHDLTRLFLGYWDAFRGGWVCIAAAFIFASGLKRIWGLTLFLAATLSAMLCNGDYSRSTAIAIPLVLFGLYEWVRREPNNQPNKPWLNKVSIPVFSLALLNYLTPAYHAFRAFHMQIESLPTQIKMSRLYFEYTRIHHGYVDKLFNLALRDAPSAGQTAAPERKESPAAPR